MALGMCGHTSCAPNTNALHYPARAPPTPRREEPSKTVITIMHVSGRHLTMHWASISNIRHFTHICAWVGAGLNLKVMAQPEVIEQMRIVYDLGERYGKVELWWNSGAEAAEASWTEMKENLESFDVVGVEVIM